MMGAERRSMVMSEDEKRLTAYHEAGHAIVGLNVPDHDPVYKISIMPRGRALGVTMFLPEDDRYSYSKRRLESQLASLFGGRVAEELIFGFDAVTTGASNDIERATEIARNMVTRWGLSTRLGPLAYGDDEAAGYMGGGYGGRSGSQAMSDDTAHAIDEEVRSIVNRNYDQARSILQASMDKLHVMADALMKYETIDREQIDAIMAGHEPPPPKGWDEKRDDDSDSSSGKTAATDSKPTVSGTGGSPELPGPIA